MAVLPIVERELRVAARQPRSWWRRVLAGGTGVIILILVYLNVSRFSTPADLGREMFEALAAFAFVLALLAGPLATSDCLSSERREGTLGLLFLTDLRGYDVVFGKLCASSLNMVFTFLTLLPLLALPLLMGGVTLKQFALVALALGDILFLSLATGIFVSSFCTSARKSLVIAVIILAVLTIGIPLVGGEIFHINPSNPLGPFVYSFCPLFAMDYLMSRFTTRPDWHLWLNVSALHVLAWVFIRQACWNTSRGWQDRPPSVRQLRWRERFQRWSTGARATQKAYRRRMLDRNPVCWLDDRYRLQRSVLWLIVLAFVAVWVIGYDQGWYWATQEAVMWAIFLNCGVYIWIALQAAHRFTEDRQSGALELLLTTPIGEKILVQGRMLALRRQFGWIVLVLMATDVMIFRALLVAHFGGHFSLHDEVAVVFVCGFILFPFQAWCQAQVGVYLSLRHKNSLTAAVGTIWRVSLLPWLVFGVVAVVYDVWLESTFRVRDRTAIVVWFAIQMATGLVFLLIANHQLRCHFRKLATGMVKTPWWWRVLKV